MRPSPFDQFVSDLFALLQRAPTWVGPVIALVAYAGLTWFVPWAVGPVDDAEPVRRPALQLISNVAPALAPYFVGVILVVWVIAEVRKLAARQSQLPDHDARR